MEPDRYRYAKLRYASIRRAAYNVVVADTSGESSPSRVRFADIDARALGAWERTWTAPRRNAGGGWNWRGLVEEFRSNPAALRVALWSGDVLCGMGLGRPSSRTARGTRSRFSMHYLEGNPDPSHPLKHRVAGLILSVAEAYGRDLGASTLHLVDALPAVVPVYVSLGFTVVRSPTGVVYCEKEIRR